MDTLKEIVELSHEFGTPEFVKGGGAHESRVLERFVKNGISATFTISGSDTCQGHIEVKFHNTSDCAWINDAVVVRQRQPPIVRHKGKRLSLLR